MARGSFFPNATLNVDISPEYMGVGYVIGPRIAGVDVRRRRAVVAGAAAAVHDDGRVHDGAVPAGAGQRQDAQTQMSAGEIWRAYIRYTGAGAVLASGIITLARTLPTIVSSFRDSVKDLRGGSGARGDPGPHRAATCRCCSCSAARWRWRSSSLAMPKLPTYGNVLATRPDHRLRLLLRHRLVAHHRPDRQLVEPDLGHDDRHADPDLHDLRRARLDRRRLRADRAVASAPSSASPRPTPARPRRISRPASSSAPRRAISRSA